MCDLEVAFNPLRYHSFKSRRYFIKIFSSEKNYQTGTQKYPKVPTFSGTFCKNLLRKGTFGYLPPPPPQSTSFRPARLLGGTYDAYFSCWQPRNLKPDSWVQGSISGRGAASHGVSVFDVVLRTPLGLCSPPVDSAE